MTSKTILLVEDNDGDIFITTEALKEGNVTAKVSVVKNGKEAIDFVFKRGAYQNTQNPDLILLDINLPGLNGHEVLKAVKSESNTRKIPVVILTTSSAERDINLAYSLHANGYIVKPLDMDGMISSMSHLGLFWFQAVSLPSEVSANYHLLNDSPQY